MQWEADGSVCKIRHIWDNTDAGNRDCFVFCEFEEMFRHKKPPSDLWQIRGGISVIHLRGQPLLFQKRRIYRLFLQ